MMERKLIRRESSVERHPTEDAETHNDDNSVARAPVNQASNYKRQSLVRLFSLFIVMILFILGSCYFVYQRNEPATPAQMQANLPFTSIRQLILDHAPSSTEHSFLLPTSPQSKALAWVITAAHGAEPDEVLTRFALATLLFATGQDVPMEECTILNTCDSDSVYTRLDLSYRGISGELPPEISLLSNKLTYLDLSCNKLLGTIPSELGALTKLVEMNLNHNSFHGGIPSQLGLLTRMTKMEFVAMRGISGTIPNEFERLVQLKSFVLINTNVTGPLPRWIGNWVNCSVVHLHKNPQLTGTLPTELAMLKKLTDFTVTENNLMTGEIPAELWNLQHLKSLTIYESTMKGTFATQIGKELKILRLNMELLTGTIPTALGNLSNLETLSIFAPRLYGTMPHELSLCRKLLSLTISHTNLSHTLPNQLANLESLEVLILESNQFTGTIPLEWAKMTNLVFLSVENNQLTGPIPVLEGLELLHLGFNKGFSGTIASCFGKDVIVDCHKVACDCCQCTDVVF